VRVCVCVRLVCVCVGAVAVAVARVVDVLTVVKVGEHERATEQSE